MAATVVMYYYYGSGPTGEQINTNLRHKLADNNTQDLLDPLIKPVAGTNLSYWKVIAPYATAPPDNGIDNVKLYTNGGNPWTGITYYVGDTTPATYSQATGSGDSGDAMVANYGGGSVLGGQTNIFSFTSGSPKSITGSIGAATGKITNYIVTQLELGITVTAGTKAQEIFTIVYDEI